MLCHRFLHIPRSYYFIKNTIKINLKITPIINTFIKPVLKPSANKLHAFVKAKKYSGRFYIINLSIQSVF
jgi:hypothetical protein